MKTVRQLEVRQNGELKHVCRYDFNAGLLYQQNRSKDVCVPKDEFLFTLADWQREREAQGQTVIGRDVGIKELWPTK